MQDGGRNFLESTDAVADSSHWRFAQSPRVLALLSLLYRTQELVGDGDVNSAAIAAAAATAACEQASPPAAMPPAVCTCECNGPGMGICGRIVCASAGGCACDGVTVFSERLGRWGVMRPTLLPGGRPEWGTETGWLHFDHSVYARPRFNHIQALLTLTHQTAASGGLLAVPGFHRRFCAWRDTHPVGSVLTDAGRVVDAAFGAQCPFPFPRDDPAYSEALRIVAPAGSLVLWDSRIPHANFPNSSGTELRVVAYLHVSRLLARAPPVASLGPSGRVIPAKEADSDCQAAAASAAATGVALGSDDASSDEADVRAALRDRALLLQRRWLVNEALIASGTAALAVDASALGSTAAAARAFSWPVALSKLGRLVTLSSKVPLPDATDLDSATAALTTAACGVVAADPDLSGISLEALGSALRLALAGAAAEAVGDGLRAVDLFSRAERALHYRLDPWLAALFMQ
jgi:hypothetical protein